MEQIQLSVEQSKDYREVETLTREAFWNIHVPGCNEHYLLHVMRKTEEYLPMLSVVAKVNEEIVGHIAYTKAVILGDTGNTCEVIMFGPISVLPAWQGKGIGSRLINHTRQLAREMGYRGVVIYGDPDYYTRLGFLPAETYGIGNAENEYCAPLLALELYPGALQNGGGRFREADVFSIDDEMATEFDRTFPSKEYRNNLPSQQKFMKLVTMRKPRN